MSRFNKYLKRMKLSFCTGRFIILYLTQVVVIFRRYRVWVWRVQIIQVNCLQIKIQLDIESSQSLVSTLTGNKVQYGGSSNNKFKITAFNCLN